MIDRGKHLLEHFGEVEFARVDDDRVVGDRERRILARNVPLVALVDLGQRLFVCADAALGCVLCKASAGPGLGFSGEKKFDVSIRKNDAADIAALEHTAFGADRPIVRW